MSTYNWSPANSFSQCAPAAETVRQSVIVRAGTCTSADAAAGNSRKSSKSRKQLQTKDGGPAAVQSSWAGAAPNSTPRENGPWNALPDLVPPSSWPVDGHRYDANGPHNAGPVPHQTFCRQPYGYRHPNAEEECDGSGCDLQFSNNSSRHPPSSLPEQYHQRLLLANSRHSFAMHRSSSELYPLPPPALQRGYRRTDSPTWHTQAYENPSSLHQTFGYHCPSPLRGGDSQCLPSDLSGNVQGPSFHPSYHLPQQQLQNTSLVHGRALPVPVGPVPVDQADSDGDIALHIAVAKEDEAVVAHLIQLMLSFRVPLDIRNKLQQTALHLAVITKNASIIQRLLLAGACPSLPDRHGNNAVHLAVRSSSIEVLNLLLDYPLSIKALRRYNYNGYAPLHLAVFRRDLEILSLLVAKGAECNCLDGTSGRTPLFHAVLNGQEDVVARLIYLGASVNLANFAGITPLVVATDRRLKNITSLLISKGATVNSRDEP